MPRLLYGLGRSCSGLFGVGLETFRIWVVDMRTGFFDRRKGRRERDRERERESESDIDRVTCSDSDIYVYVSMVLCALYIEAESFTERHVGEGGGGVLVLSFSRDGRMGATGIRTAYREALYLRNPVCTSLLPPLLIMDQILP